MNSLAASRRESNLIGAQMLNGLSAADRSVAIRVLPDLQRFRFWSVA
jgi:hypothetical protein